MSGLVTIATYLKSHEAHLARTRLEAEEIPAFVIGDQSMDVNHLFTFYPGVSIRLQVRSEDVDKAREILEEEGAYAKSLDVETCPKCESVEIKRYFSDHRTLLALSYILAPLILLVGWWWRWRKCLSCGHRWKPR